MKKDIIKVCVGIGVGCLVGGVISLFNKRRRQREKEEMEEMMNMTKESFKKWMEEDTKERFSKREEEA